MLAPPELMLKAGIDWRWALPSDLKCIFANWFDSQLMPFVKGPGCPFPRFAVTVADARARNLTKLLMKIYHAEMKPLIEKALLNSPTLVAYNVDLPEQIIGWAHHDYTYVMLDFRHCGVATALRAALESRD
jgi:hypothetical protein